MAFAHAGGMSSMLKDGAKQMSGLEEAVLKNVSLSPSPLVLPVPGAISQISTRDEQIEACKELAVMVRTSMGPNGMNKMVINHLERLFVTSDARTIVTELEVQHPAGTRVEPVNRSSISESLNEGPSAQQKF